MKILLLSFGPGGMLHYAVDVATSLMENGEDVILLSTHTSDVVPQNLPIKLISGYEIKKILLFISQHNPDIIHITAFHPILFFLVSLLKKRKLIYTIHDCVSHPYGSFSLRRIKLLLVYNRFILKYILSKVASVVSLSAYVAGEVKVKYSINCKIIHLINSRTKFDLISKKSSEKIFDTSYINVLFFGSLSDYKGAKVIVDCLTHIDNNSKYKKIRFVIAGRINRHDSILKYWGSNNLQILNRFIDESEISSLFSNADLLVLPYNEVSQSGVLSLAISYNKKVILPNLGSFVEYKLAYPNICLLPQLDAKNILDKILELKDFVNTQDSFKENQTFSLKEFGSQYLQIYKMNSGK